MAEFVCLLSPAGATCGGGALVTQLLDGADSDARAPAEDWYFAEGAGGSAWDMYLLLQNPGDPRRPPLRLRRRHARPVAGAVPLLLIANPSRPAVSVSIQYLGTAGELLTRSYDVPAGRRLTLDVRNEGPSLADTEFGIVVSSTNDTPIVVERSQYWTFGSSRFIGAMSTMGTPLPALTPS